MQRMHTDQCFSVSRQTEQNSSSFPFDFEATGIPVIVQKQEENY